MKTATVDVWELVRDWPQGQSRSYGDVHQQGEGAPRRVISSAIKDGYLTEKHTQKTGSIYTRTRKKVVAPEFLPSPAGDPFPWRVPEHWFRVKHSPVHELNFTLHEFLGYGKNWRDPDFRAKQERHWEIDAEFPKVHSQSQLESLRGLLREVFVLGGIFTPLVSPKLRLWTRSGEDLAALCWYLLLRPRFDESGGFQRFDPVEPECQLDSLAHLQQTRPTLAERYYLRYGRLGQPREGKVYPYTCPAHFRMVTEDDGNEMSSEWTRLNTRFSKLDWKAARQARANVAVYGLLHDMRVRSKTGMQTLRTQTHDVFRYGDVPKVSNDITRVRFSDEHRLRLWLIRILCEPVFDEQGKFLQFDPIPDEGSLRLFMETLNNRPSLHDEMLAALAR